MPPGVQRPTELFPPPLPLHPLRPSHTPAASSSTASAPKAEASAADEAMEVDNGDSEDAKAKAEAEDLIRPRETRCTRPASLTKQSSTTRRLGTSGQKTSLS